MRGFAFFCLVLLSGAFAGYADIGLELLSGHVPSDCGEASWFLYSSSEYCGEGHELGCQLISDAGSYVDSLCLIEDDPSPFLAGYAFARAFEHTNENKYLEKAKFFTSAPIEKKSVFWYLANIELYELTKEQEYLGKASSFEGVSSLIGVREYCGWSLTVNSRLARLGVDYEEKECYSYLPFPEQSYWVVIGNIDMYEAMIGKGLDAKEYALDALSVLKKSNDPVDLWGLSWEINALSRYCMAFEDSSYCKKAMEKAEAVYCLETGWKEEIYREVKVCTQEASLDDITVLEEKVEFSDDLMYYSPAMLERPDRGKIWLSLAYLELDKACEQGLCPESVETKKLAFPNEVRERSSVIFAFSSLLVLIIVSIVLVKFNQKQSE